MKAAGWLNQHLHNGCLLRRLLLMQMTVCTLTPPPLQIASAGSGLDVAKVAEAQPGLLLLGGAVWEDQESLKEQLTVSIST